jgi:hypothetical protein
MPHRYYSQRTGTNPHADGLPLEHIKELFNGLYSTLEAEGYFDEAFGEYIPDVGLAGGGAIADVAREILLKVHKKNLWPIWKEIEKYSEDDLCDMIEFLYQHVSIRQDDRTYSKDGGQTRFLGEVNELLSHYNRYSDPPLQLAANGEIVERAPTGFDQLLDAPVPSADDNVTKRIG